MNSRESAAAASKGFPPPFSQASADKENKEDVIKLLSYKDPEYNIHDSDSRYTSRDSAGIWRGGWLHSGLYSVRIKTFTDSPQNVVRTKVNGVFPLAAPSRRVGSLTLPRLQARRITATDHDIQYGYCGLTTLMTNITGEVERSLIVGSAYGMLYYMRNLADNAVALRGRQPLLGQHGAVMQHMYPR